jgi:hypothetical protein
VAKNPKKPLKKGGTFKQAQLPELLLTGTLQRQNTEHFKQIFQKKELSGLSPNFHIQVFMYIPTIGLPILLQENMWTNRGNI